MYRSRAMAMPGARRALVAGYAGIALLAAGAVSGGMAADDESEVPIGTFHLNARPAPEANTVDPVVQSPERRDSGRAGGSDQAADKLFSDALAALEAGREQSAQRLFERLVARAPDSAIAARARRHLAELYRAAPAGPGTVPERPASARAGDSARPELGHGAGSDQAQARPASRAPIGAPVPGSLEDQFIAEAGDRVFFSAGSAEIGGRARSVIAAQARFIKRRSELDAAIEGHADDAPLSIEQHEALSEERAEAVRQRLIAEGIEPERLTIVPWGRDHRVSECPDPDCAVQNRRAVTVLTIHGSRRGSGPLGARPQGIPLAAGDPVAATQ